MSKRTFKNTSKDLNVRRLYVDGYNTDSLTVRQNQNGDTVFKVNTVDGKVDIVGDLSVQGNSTFTDTSNFSVSDNLISMASGNTGGDTLDIGFYGTYNDGTTKYTGMFRDQSDSGTWKLVEGITTEPGSGSNFPSDVSGNKADLLVGNITGDILTATNKVLVPNGSAGDPSYSFSSDTNTGLFTVGSNTLCFSTNNTEVMRLSSDKLGIGTNDPERRLEIVDASGAQLRLSDVNGVAYTDFRTNSSGDLTITPTGGDISIEGKMGFNTVSPATTLYVQSGTNDGISLRSFQIPGAGNDFTGMYFSVADNTVATGSLSYAKGGIFYQDNSYANGFGDMHFCNNNTASASTVSTSDAKMTISSNGNVGIGTTSPDRKVEILDASNPQLRLSHTDSSVYTDFQTDSSGNMTITPSGTSTTIDKSNATASNTLSVNGSVAIGRSTTSDVIIQRNRQVTGSYGMIISGGTGIEQDGFPTTITDANPGGYIKLTGGTITDDFGGSVDITANGKTEGIASNQIRFNNRSGVNTSSLRMLVDDGGFVGVNTDSPDRRFEVLDDTNPQLRLTHTDSVNYCDFQVDSSGDLSITLSGSDASINGVLTSTGVNFGQSSLSYFDSGTFSTVFQFVSNTSSSITIAYQRVQSVVTLFIPAFSITSPSGGGTSPMVSTTAIATSLRPATSQNTTPCIMTNGTEVSVKCIMATNGQLSFSAIGTPSGLSEANGITSSSFVITYTIN